MGELFIPDTDRLPFFVSAGIIKTEDEIEQYATNPYISAQVIGSFSEPEWGGNDPTGTKTVFWYDQQDKAAYNAVGLRNPGRKAASEYLPRAIRQVQAAGQIAIISVTSLEHEEPRQILPALAEWALDMGADGVEIDGSCPNHGSVLCGDVDAMGEVATAVRDRVGESPYLSVKLSDLPEPTIHNYKHETPLPVDGIALINAIRKQAPINPRTRSRSITVNDGYAGQSGPVIKDVAVYNLETWALTEDGKLPDSFGANGASAYNYQLWSVGGVDSGYEAYRRVRHSGAFMAGAAQPFRRSRNPKALMRQWAQEYDHALKGAASGSL